MPIGANEAVSLGGATVVPGDYVFADGAGAVVIPSSLLDASMSMAREIEAADADFLKTIRDKDPEAVLKAGSGET